MTERLYYTDAMCTRFEARVVDAADEGRRVYLDRSAFYPTSGGQPHDLGTLGGTAVLDVVDEGDRVAHLLAAPLETPQVTGEVDWARRFDHMQQHTGQHLLSAIFAERWGWETVSVHFGPESATLDLSVDVVPPQALAAAADLANTIIAENRPVTVSFEDAAQAQGLRKPSDRTGTLRIVSIEGIDRSACGGTHVRATGEIGVVLIRRQERVKKLARIEFVCGLRAARRARADYEVLARMAVSASAAIDDLPALVATQVAELKSAEQGRRRLEEELATFRARAMWEAAVPGVTGRRNVMEVRPTGRADEVRALAMALADLPNTAYAVRMEGTHALLLAASADSGIDAGQVLRDVLGAVGGRGGGSPRLAQGSTPGPEALQEAWASLGARLEGAR